MAKVKKINEKEIVKNEVMEIIEIKTFVVEV